MGCDGMCWGARVLWVGVWMWVWHGSGSGPFKHNGHIRLSHSSKKARSRHATPCLLAILWASYVGSRSRRNKPENASRFGLLYVHTCTGQGRSGPYIETGIETGIETAVKNIQTIETVGRGALA